MDLGEDAVQTAELLWKTRSDHLLYNKKLSDIDSCIKHKILSPIASLFDQIGLLIPVIVVAKIIMQSLWLKNVGRDDRLPEKGCAKWKDFWYEINNKNKI